MYSLPLLSSGSPVRGRKAHGLNEDRGNTVLVRDLVSASKRVEQQQRHSHRDHLYERVDSHSLSSSEKSPFTTHGTEHYDWRMEAANLYQQKQTDSGIWSPKSSSLNSAVSRVKTSSIRGDNVPVVELQPFSKHQWRPANSRPDGEGYRPPDFIENGESTVAAESQSKSGFLLPNGYPHPEKLLSPRTADDTCTTSHHSGHERRLAHPKQTREVTMLVRESSFVPLVERQKSTAHDIAGRSLESPISTVTVPSVPRSPQRQISRPTKRSAIVIAGNRFADPAHAPANPLYMPVWETYKGLAKHHSVDAEDANAMEVLPDSSDLFNQYYQDDIYDVFDRAMTLTSITAKSAAVRQSSSNDAAKQNGSRKQRKSARYGVTPAYRLGVANSLEVLTAYGKPLSFEKALSESLRANIFKLKQTKDASFIQSDFLPKRSYAHGYDGLIKVRSTTQKDMLLKPRTAIHYNQTTKGLTFNQEQRSFHANEFTPNHTSGLTRSFPHIRRKVQSKNPKMDYLESNYEIQERFNTKLKRGRAPLSGYKPETLDNSVNFKKSVKRVEPLPTVAHKKSSVLDAPVVATDELTIPIPSEKTPSGGDSIDIAQYEDSYSSSVCDVPRVIHDVQASNPLELQEPISGNELIDTQEATETFANTSNNDSAECEGITANDGGNVSSSSAGSLSEPLSSTTRHNDLEIIPVPGIDYDGSYHGSVSSTDTDSELNSNVNIATAEVSESTPAHDVTNGLTDVSNQPSTQSLETTASSTIGHREDDHRNQTRDHTTVGVPTKETVNDDRILTRNNTVTVLGSVDNTTGDVDSEGLDMINTSVVMTEQLGYNSNDISSTEHISGRVNLIALLGDSDINFKERTFLTRADTSNELLKAIHQ